MLIELLFEVVLQLAAEALWEALARGVFKGLRVAGERTTWQGTGAAVGALARGCAAGWLSIWVFPSPITGIRPPSGLSLLLVPLATGLTMWAVGRYRAQRGPAPTGLLTFWLAFDFAFAMAAARFFLLNPHIFS